MKTVSYWFNILFKVFTLNNEYSINEWRKSSNILVDYKQLSTKIFGKFQSEKLWISVSDRTISGR